jgi:hypothetical protein
METEGGRKRTFLLAVRVLIPLRAVDEPHQRAVEELRVHSVGMWVLLRLGIVLKVEPV